MDISEKKSNAARINGAKSRGPTSPQGKRASSKNALRHGILANTLLIDGESRDRFLELANTLSAELAPESLAEQLLVEKIVAAQWRLRRTWAVEAAGISREIRRLPDSMATEAAPIKVLEAMRAAAESGVKPETLNYYERRFDIIQHRAYEDLVRARQRRLLHDKRTQQVDENKEPALETEPTENPCETQ